jgi:hypothetical protein
MNSALPGTGIGTRGAERRALWEIDAAARKLAPELIAMPIRSVADIAPLHPPAPFSWPLRNHLVRLGATIWAALRIVWGMPPLPFRGRLAPRTSTPLGAPLGAWIGPWGGCGYSRQDCWCAGCRGRSGLHARKRGRPDGDPCAPHLPHHASQTSYPAMMAAGWRIAADYSILSWRFRERAGWL